MVKVNRRLFKTSNGKIVETDFDVYWYCIDEDGEMVLFSERPFQGWHSWCSSICTMWKYIGFINQSANWKKCRWYLKDDGTWVRR